MSVEAPPAAIEAALAAGVDPERLAVGCVCPQRHRSCPVHGFACYHQFTEADWRSDGEHYAAWGDWFDAHGIGDRMQIAANPGWVVRNVDACQVVLLEFWYPYDIERESDLTYAYAVASGASYRARIVQLDRVPDPFPCDCRVTPDRPDLP